MNKTLSSKKFLVLTSSVLLLAGCGGNSTPASSSAAPSSSTPASSQASQSSAISSPSASYEDPKEVTIPFWHWSGQGVVDALTKKANQFSKAVEENLGVKVTIEPVYKGAYTDMQALVQKSFAAGTTPTIAVAYPDHVANYIAEEGSQHGRYVWDLDPFMNDSSFGFGTQSYLGDKAEYDADDFVEAFLEEGQSYVNKGTYSLPFMKSSEVMMYNIEATNKAIALLHPELEKGRYEDYLNSMSWTEFMALSKCALDNKETVDPLMECPAYYDSDGNLFVTKMYQNQIGYSEINDAGQGVISFEDGENRTKTETMINSLSQNVKDGLLTTKGIKGVYSSDYFKSMKSIFAIGSSGGAGYSDPSSDTFHVGVCRVPYDNENPLYVTQGLTLTFLKNSSLSDNENYARMKFGWMFAKYITNPDANVFLSVSGSQGYIPVRYSAYDSETYVSYINDPDGGIMADCAKLLINKLSRSYITSPVFKGSAELRTACGAILASVSSNEKTTSQAISDAINTAKKAM